MNRISNKLEGYLEKETGTIYRPDEIKALWSEMVKTLDIPVGSYKPLGGKTVVTSRTAKLPFKNNAYIGIFHQLSQHLSEGENAIYITEHKDKTYTYARTHEDIGNICNTCRPTISKFLKEADKLGVVGHFKDVDRKWFINPIYAYNGLHLPIWLRKAFNSQGRKSQKSPPVILKEDRFYYESGVTGKSGSWPGQVLWDGATYYKEDRVYFHIRPVVGDSVVIEIIMNEKGCCNKQASSKKFYELNKGIFEELYNSIIRS